MAKPAPASIRPGSCLKRLAVQTAMLESEMGAGDGPAHPETRSIS
ncbi:hypothetical protein [Mycobacterium sp.]